MKPVEHSIERDRRYIVLMFILATLILISPTIIASLFQGQIIYALMQMEVEQDESLAGLYNPTIDRYVCTDENSCFHEQGHAYDASGAPRTILIDQWRSAGSDYRANVNIINDCITDFTNNNSDPKNRNLLEDKVFALVNGNISRWRKDELQEYKQYSETYASAYAIMKQHRWDEYHYDDVEDMIAQKAQYCQDIQIEIAAYYE